MNGADIALLVYLDALLDAGSVSQAAQRLGLSTPAMSHALARLRERFDDPLLVRVGRSMRLTPRAEELKPKLHSLISQGKNLFEEEKNFSPKNIHRIFSIYCTDHCILVLEPIINKLLTQCAPGVSLKFLPSAIDDWQKLRDGSADVSICLTNHFPNEFLARRIFTERYVCALAQKHPSIKAKLSLKDYLAQEHIVVSPLGYPCNVDTVLARMGHRRKIRATVPYFLTGLHMLSNSSAILTVSERVALAMKDLFNLKLFTPPFAIPDYSLSLIWHPRVDKDREHAWLREQLIQAAKLSELAIK